MLVVVDLDERCDVGFEAGTVTVFVTVTGALPPPPQPAKKTVKRMTGNALRMITAPKKNTIFSQT